MWLLVILNASHWCKQIERNEDEWIFNDMNIFAKLRSILWKCMASSPSLNCIYRYRYRIVWSNLFYMFNINEKREKSQRAGFFHCILIMIEYVFFLSVRVCIWFSSSFLSIFLIILYADPCNRVHHDQWIDWKIFTLPQHFFVALVANKNKCGTLQWVHSFIVYISESINWEQK